MQYLIDACLLVMSECVQANFRRCGWFVYAVDTGEIYQLSAPRLGIQSFRIAAFAFFEWGVHKDFQEFSGLKARPGDFPLGTIWADKRDDHHEPRIHKQPRNLGYAANVFDAIGLGKSKVPVQTVANVVAIEDICVPSRCEHPLFEKVRNIRR